MSGNIAIGMRQAAATPPAAISSQTAIVVLG